MDVTTLLASLSVAPGDRVGARVVDVTTLLASLSVAPGDRVGGSGRGCDHFARLTVSCPGDRVGARVVDVTTLLASLSVARGIGWGLGSWM